MKLNRNNYCNKWGVTGNNCSYYTWNRGGKNENKHMFCAVVVPQLNKFRQINRQSICDVKSWKASNIFTPCVQQ